MYIYLVFENKMANEIGKKRVHKLKSYNKFEIIKKDA